MFINYLGTITLKILVSRQERNVFDNEHITDGRYIVSSDAVTLREIIFKIINCAFFMYSYSKKHNFLGPIWLPVYSYESDKIKHACTCTKMRNDLIGRGMEKSYFQRIYSKSVFECSYFVCGRELFTADRAK